MEVPRLHPDTIEELKNRIDIVDIISEYVVLKKRGKDYVGLCPFHEEKSPSFSVSPSKQLYYCFGCNAGGNGFKFLMELGKQSFSEVVFDLAKRYQIPIKTLEPEQRQEVQRQLSLREQLYEILAITASFYQHALRQPQGEKALTYLKEKRKLREETIQTFQLGYAPAGWETLYCYLVEQKRYAVALVAEAGLIKLRKSGNSYYDQFRDRLMIPIQDVQGKVIGFGSRTLGSEEPKYLNSPETPLFNKSKILFALDKAKTSIQKQDKAIVVEGYFDVIALHAAGITNGVAALGTAFNQDHLKQLLRYTDSKQVIFNFDADKAGINATKRAIGEIENLVYSGQVQLRIINLPDGKDADEFLNYGDNSSAEYQKLIDNAPLWFDWQIQQLLVGKNLKQADHFEQVSASMIKLLNQIEDNNKRSYYVDYCATILSQSDCRLIDSYLMDLRSKLQKTKQERSRHLLKPLKSSIKPENTALRNRQELAITFLDSDNDTLENAEKLLLTIYIHCPEYRQEITNFLEEKDLFFSNHKYRFLWQQILKIEKQNFQQNQLISILQDHYLDFPEQMAQINHLFHLNEIDREHIFRTSIIIRTAIATLEIVTWDKYYRYCVNQLGKLNTSKEIEIQQYQYFNEEMQKANQKIQELKKQRLSQTQVI